MPTLLNQSDSFEKIVNSTGETAVTTSGLGYSNDPMLVFTNNDALAVDAATAVEQQVYFEFNIPVVPNGALTLTNLSFNIARSGANTPAGYVVRSSVDGFTTDLATADVATQRTTYTAVSIDLGSDFIAVTDSVLFRVYIYTPNTGESMDLDDIIVTGDSIKYESVAAFKNHKDVVDAELNGQTRNYIWRKAPAVTPTANVWFDMSMSPGNPAAQYYIGGITTSTILARSTDNGLQHGASVSPAKKYIRKITAVTQTLATLPMPMWLCDYLMFYPFIDMSITDQQDMTNSVTIPRYTDGRGVQMMAILTNAGVGGQSFNVSYTNQDGVAGRTTPNIVMNASTASGTILTSAVGTLFRSGNPFMGLQKGDTGVRSIQSVTMAGADVGLFALCLVKPLCETQMKEVSAPFEKDFLLSGGMPQVKDDAYLNWLCAPASGFGTITGDMQVVWN
jgi:hypothetical protein